MERATVCVVLLLSAALASDRAAVTSILFTSIL